MTSLADLLFPVSQESVKVFHIKELSHEIDLKNLKNFEKIVYICSFDCDKNLQH